MPPRRSRTLVSSRSSCVSALFPMQTTLTLGPLRTPTNHIHGKNTCFQSDGVFADRRAGAFSNPKKLANSDKPRPSWNTVFQQGYARRDETADGQCITSDSPIGAHSQLEPAVVQLSPENLHSPESLEPKRRKIGGRFATMESSIRARSDVRTTHSQ